MPGRWIWASRSSFKAIASCASTLSHPSIPPLVAHLNLTTLDANRESSGGLEGRRSQGGAGSDTKPRTVPRADDLVAFDRPSGEDPAVVGADVLDRIELTLEVEDGDLRAVDIDYPVGT